jgi:hypothetical protein
MEASQLWRAGASDDTEMHISQSSTAMLVGPAHENTGLSRIGEPRLARTAIQQALRLP